MGKLSPDNEHYMATVKLGPKGQIVIPKEVREMLGVEPGDSLLLLADREKGVALQRLSVFTAIADAIFAGKAGEIYPEQPEEQSRTFAQAIRETEKEEAEQP